jgi:hypothetical protein
MTNFAFAVLAARALPPEHFGALSLALAAYAIALGASRAAASEPLVMRFSDATEVEWRRAAASSGGASMLVGIVGGGVCISAAVLARGPMGQSLMGLGVMLPFLLLQDNWRFAFFARGQGKRSFANDLTWALVQFPALLVVVSLVPRPETIWFILIWGGAASVASGVGIHQAGVKPQVRAAFAWWKEQWDVMPRILGEFIAATGASQVSLLGVAWVADLAAVGAIRGAFVLMGPVNVVVLGVSLVAIPESVNRLRTSASALRRGSVLISSGLAVAAMTWGLVLMALPSTVGAEVLGDTWTGARGALPGLILWQTSLAVSVGPVAGLRALGAVRHSFHARIAVAPLLVAGGVAGATIAGSRGGALGLGAANAFGALIWWVQLRRALGERELTRRDLPAD